jgi:hypothetical protein
MVVGVEREGVEGVAEEKQVLADMQLLRNDVGINEHLAWELALLVAQRGGPVGYVAEVVEYATRTVGINNPAGCVIELIRRNERRKPHTREPSKPSPQPSSYSQPFDVEKYTTGKYAFLFQRPWHRHGSDGSGASGASGGNKVIGHRSHRSGRKGSKRLSKDMGGENHKQETPDYRNGPDGCTQT